MSSRYIIGKSEKILITGSNGFVGSRVVKSLVSKGFTNLRCFVRPPREPAALMKITRDNPECTIEIFKGNLLSPEDCSRACEDVSLIYHLAVSSEKSFPGSVMNCVVTTRNLLEGAVQQNCVKRFLNVSSFAIYSNLKMRRNSLLDETCEIEDHPYEKFEAYTYAKMKQDELVQSYSTEYGLPHVDIRPGVVYGPGQNGLTGRVGIDTFGVFLHLGGKNQIPLTHVDNCAEAVVLAGLRKGIDGSAFNVVDDDLPSSRKLLKLYKKNYRNFFSIYIPYPLFYFLNFLWEKYSGWSRNQLPPAFNRRKCSAYWKGNVYSNRKLKSEVGWEPVISTERALENYAEELKRAGGKI